MRIFAAWALLVCADVASAGLAFDVRETISGHPGLVLKTTETVVHVFIDGGKTEFRTSGIQFGSKFHAWENLRKFEWPTRERSTPVLRIKIDTGDILQIQAPQDPAVEVVLLKHGLVPW